ncbi:MAG: DegT/DnrJ/EryC1/StrS aminotransferase, partial [Dehalococcoidia bacterium]|nr:DegT/DnrJ/EryC1/StrS aminotransferase [Dehalococcoidia bacterium]
VYGFNDSAELDEESLVGPSFPYAISKLMGERAIQCLTDDSFRPIILRKGTVIGWSPKMRYDLAANTMVKTAYTQGKITVNNPSLWRPFIDVKDVAMAYVRALDADPALSGVFNIAYDNFTIGRLADDVAAALRDFEIHVPVETFRRHDLRSYRVSTRKAREILDFHAEVSIKQSVAEVVEHVLSGENSDFDNPIYTNVQWMTMKLAEGVPLG